MFGPWGGGRPVRPYLDPPMQWRTLSKQSNHVGFLSQTGCLVTIRNEQVSHSEQTHDAGNF